MNTPKNPYNERVEIYRHKAIQALKPNADKLHPLFHIDQTWYHGQQKGWDEGYEKGIERYFNVENENDCADALYTYLAALQLKIAKEFGTESVMHEVLESFFFNLQEAPVPPPGETDPLCSLYLLEDKETGIPYRFMKGRIEEHTYVGGVWVQPHSWADELN